MTAADFEPTAPDVSGAVEQTRAELEHLAAGLARAHTKVAKAPGKRLPLLHHPDRCEALLSSAQRHYAAATDHTHTISYAGEWLLDNYYVVQQAFRQAGEDIPDRYYRELPKLADGPLEGNVRVYVIAHEISSVAVNTLSLDQIIAFVTAYQETTPLTMGELWALPAMLRVVNLENLIRTLGSLTGVPDTDAISCVGIASEAAVDESHVATAIINLRMLATQDWRTYFEAVSRVEQLLQRDPAGIYAKMDFATRNEYRRMVEVLSPDTPADEERVAKAAIRLAERAAERDGTGALEAHVGFYLRDLGQDRLKADIAYRPDLADRFYAFRKRYPLALYLAAIAVLMLGVLVPLDAAMAATGAGLPQIVTIVLLAIIPTSAVAVNVVNWLITRTVKPTFMPKMNFSEGIPAAFATLIVIPALLTDDDETRSLAHQLELHFLRNSDPNLTYALLLDFADAPEQTQAEDEALLAYARQTVKAINDRHAETGRRPFFLLVRERRWNEAEGVWLGWERKRGKLAELNALILDPHAETSYTVCDADMASLNRVRYVITLDADTVMPNDSALRLIGTMAHPLNRPRFDENGQAYAGYTVMQPRIEILPPTANRTVFARIFAGDTGYDLYTLAVSDAYQDWFGEGIFTGKGIYDVAGFERSLRGRTPENAILSHDLFEGIHGRAALVTDVVLLEDYPAHYLVHTRRMHRWIRGDWQLLPWLRGRVPMEDGAAGPSPLSGLDRWKLLDNLRRSLVAPALLALFIAGWLLLPMPPVLWMAAALAVSASPFVISAANIVIQRIQGGTWELTTKQLQANGLRWWLSLVFLPHEAFLSADAIARTLRRLRTRRHLLQWTTSAQTQQAYGSDSLMLTWEQMRGSSLFVAGLAGVLALLHPNALASGLPLLILWFLSPVVANVLSQSTGRPKATLDETQRMTVRALARRTWLYFEHFVGPEDHWLPPDHFQESPRGVVAHNTSPTNIGLLLLSTLSAYDLGYMGLSELSARLQLTFENLENLERYRGHFLNWYDTRTLTPLPPAYVSTVDSGNLACSLLALKHGLRELPGIAIMRPQRWNGLADALAVLDETLAMVRPGHSDPYIDGLRARIVEIQHKITAIAHDPVARNIYLSRLVESVWPEFTATMLEGLERDREALDVEQLSILRTFAERFGHQLSGMTRDTALLLPWIALLADPPALFADAARDPETQEIWIDLIAALPLVPLLGDVPQACRDGGIRLKRLQARLMVANAPSHELTAAVEWCKAFGETLDDVCRTCENLLADFQRTERQITAYLESMDFAFLFDDQRKLFHIGYNIASERLDDNYYDLLATEARLASLFAIAMRQVPQEHWLKLARPQTRIGDLPALLSWSGTMFEYLMPLLITRTYPGTLLDTSCEAAVDAQIVYGRQNNVPWGISESGYYAFDGSQNYQYRAFGVPALAFKRGLAADLVIAPYASMMALPVDPPAVIDNLRALIEARALGRYGLYEAVDYTRSRLELGKEVAIVREYMAHHQGMVLLTLSNMLTDHAMVRRFHADSRIQAVELLLQEQIPPAIAFEYPSPDTEDGERPNLPQLNAAPWTIQPDPPAPNVHFLSNGRYGVLITEAGGGYSQWGTAALTRWRSDTTLDNWGTWVYVRDMETGDLWSAAHQPIRAAAEAQNVVFYPHKAHFQRRDHEISMEMEITVPPEDDVEIRRIRLTNLGDTTRRLQLTSYGEVVLAPQDSDRRHPAFNKMFIESEYLPQVNGLLFRRRPRSAYDPGLFMLHMAVTQAAAETATAYETDRCSFLGRNRTAARPQALTDGSRLSGTTGATLDPILALGREIELPPHGSAQLAFVTAASDTRAGALGLARSYQVWSTLERAFEQARYRSELELRQLDIHSPDVQRFQRMLSALLYPQAALRAAPNVLAANTKGQPGLWAHGISGDYPIVLLRIGEETELPVVYELVQAHRYWRNRMIRTTLVILNQHDTGYTQELYNQVHRLIVRMGSEMWINRHDGIFLLRADLLTESDNALLAASARVTLDGKDGSIDRQLDPASRQPVYLPPFIPTAAPDTYTDMPPVPRPHSLQFDNGFGGFSADGKEYVIYREAGDPPPAPWTNVIANPGFGFTITEAGGGYTWAVNSSENRLTAWRNDPVVDMPAEAIYLRDEETAQIWSPTPLPAPTGRPVLVRHGHGYTTFEHHSHSLKQLVTMYAAPDVPVKFVKVRLENTTQRVRRITATYYAEWVLGTVKDITQAYIVPEYVPVQQTLLFRNPYSIEFGAQHAFVTANRDFHGLTTDRTEFLGRLNSNRLPAALERIGLAGTVQAGVDPCAAVQLHIDLPPGGSDEICFVLGAGENRETALDLARRSRDAAAVQAAWDESTRFWDRTVSQITVATPDAEMNMLLPWLLYQALSCRVWGRSALYQSGGAFGFRDQLQDVMAVLHVQPHLAREHILRAARHQFEAGDVLHWWHPPSGRGVRTRFSDDLVWLPYVTAYYVKTTGDDAILNESVPFLKGEPLKPDEEERYGFYEPTAESFTLYEHCKRALNRGSTAGAHGLPLMGAGDWNDGMSRVGIHGRGESVWMGWFLHTALADFLPLAERMNDPAAAAQFRSRLDGLKAALEANAWDGEWYLRAFYDDGRALGSSQNQECRIDSISQSWGIISGAADPERARQAMESVRTHLIDDENEVVLLFTPPFDKTDKDPGYIKGYPPGIRENGGQYTHAALWTAWAFAEMGDGDEAGRLFRMLNPITHSDTPAGAREYRVEPYVVAADVYGVAPHLGRGGWTWYTGSSGWMYRLGVEQILGIKREGDRLRIDPRIPRDWPSFAATYRFGQATYRIRVDNAAGVMAGVRDLTVDGELQADNQIRLADEARTFEVLVTMGDRDDDRQIEDFGSADRSAGQVR